MRFLILADRPAADLLPISNHISPPMLPIAGRPVIEHVLLMIAARGGGRVDVVLRPDDTQTERHLEAVQWPTLDVHVARSTAISAKTWHVAIRGDVCPHPEGLDAAVAACHDHRSMRSLQRSALAVIGPGEAPPSWAAFVVAVQGRQLEPWPGLFLSLADYHELALSAVSRRLGWAGITPAGWREPDGTRIGVNTRVRTRRKLGPGTSLGARAVIGIEVTLAAGAVIGDDCFVGDYAHVERSIILDRTFVGSGIEIRNAIVAGDWIYDVGRRVAAQAPERFLRPRSP